MSHNGSPLVVVTGGCGFVGKPLVALLLERGFRVRVVDLAPSPLLPPAAEFVQGSVLDREPLGEALRGAELLFHLAANPNLWDRDKSSFERLHLDGTRAVLDAAARADVGRIVHVSTESILVGIEPAPGPIDETRQLTPDQVPGPYCKSKLRAEQAALTAAANGLPVVIANPTMPVGAGDENVTPPSRLLLDLLNGRHPAFMDFTLNLVDVASLAHGLWLTASHGRLGERYILGGENLRLADLLARLEAISGRAMPRRRVPPVLALAIACLSEALADHVTRRPPAAPLSGVRIARAQRPFAIDKAMRELGYRPAPTDQALKAALQWFREQGLLHHDAAH